MNIELYGYYDGEKIVMFDDPLKAFGQFWYPFQVWRVGTGASQNVRLMISMQPKYNVF